MIDYSNNIWVASWKGIAKYDGEKWFIYDTSNTEFPNNTINSITFDNDNFLWIAGGSLWGTFWDAFIAKFDGYSWSVFRPIPNSQYGFNKIVVDNNNNKWITGMEDLFKFDGIKWSLCDTAVNVPFVTWNYWFDMKYNSKTNCLWFSTSNGLMKYDFSKFYLITNNYTNACGIDSNDNVWSSTFFSDTLQCFNKNGYLLNSFSPNNSGFPRGTYLRDITITKNGFVYMAGSAGLILNKKGNSVDIHDIFVNSHEQLFVSPNPCSDYFTISTKNLQFRQSSIVIYDINGKLVKTILKYNVCDIVNVSDLHKGIYVANLKNRNYLYYFKFIKH